MHITSPALINKVPIPKSHTSVPTHPSPMYGIPVPKGRALQYCHTLKVTLYTVHLSTPPARYDGAPRYAASRNKSPNTPPAVTSAPAPGPRTTSDCLK